MIFVDTGPLLARYLRHDQHHALSLRLWKKLEKKRQRLLTSHFVIDELGTLLRRRAGSAFTVERLREIYASSVLEIVRVDENVEYEAMEWLEKYADHDLSFTDATSFALMRRAKVTIAFSFDDHFQIAGFGAYK